MTDLLTIERDVLAIIQSYMPRRPIEKNKKLIADLKMDSDDATAMIKEIERKYRLDIPSAEWKQIATPQDVVNIIARYLQVV